MKNPLSLSLSLVNRALKAALAGLAVLVLLFIISADLTAQQPASAAPANPLMPTDSPSISVTLSANAVSLNLIPDAPADVVSLDFSASSNNPSGYYSVLSMSGEDVCLRRPADGTDCANAAAAIEPVTGFSNDSSTTFSKIEANQWGLSATLPDGSAPTGDDVAWVSVPPLSSPITMTHYRVSPPQYPPTTQSYGVTFYFGAKADDTLPSGTYEGEVVITSAADALPAPTINIVSPSTGPAAGNTAVVISGTDLGTAYQVFFDRNGNGVQDSGEACVDANIDNGGQITCTAPAGTEGLSVNVVVKTWGGVATKTGGFTYENPAPTAVWVKAANTNTAAIASITGVSAGSYTVDLDPNMLPIVNKLSNGTYPSNWCNYDAAQWCNAVTVKPATLAAYQAVPTGTEIAEDDILGYWVYVPRYAYEVQRRDAVDAFVPAQNFDIRFEKSTTTKKTPAATCSVMGSGYAIVSSSGATNKDYRTGCGISRTYDNATGTTWATHPAFTFGTTELNGLWIGKFETTGSVAAPTVKPNLKSQISQTIGVQYTIASSIGVTDPTKTGGSTAATTQNTHNLNTNKSRMLKNSEWGATSYLSSSIYGAGVNNVKINAAYKSSLQDGNGNTGYGITGCGPQTSSNENQYTITDSATTGAVSCMYSGTSHTYETATGMLASTTNNVYGIYDMSGGAYEYVLGNRTTSASQTTSNTSYLTNAITNPAYYDAYATSAAGGRFGTQPTGSNSTEYYYNNDVCTFETCGGQALHETKTVQSVSTGVQSWGGDYSYFVYSSFPWSLRGGISNIGSYVGLFSSLCNEGKADGMYGFRASLSSF
jgi:hypothetical protein